MCSCQDTRCSDKRLYISNNGIKSNIPSKAIEIGLVIGGLWWPTMVIEIGSIVNRLWQVNFTSITTMFRMTQQRKFWLSYIDLPQTSWSMLWPMLTLHWPRLTLFWHDIKYVTSTSKQTHCVLMDIQMLWQPYCNTCRFVFLTLLRSN